jgi:transcriptional regulator with XRE-family HTH domain
MNSKTLGTRLHELIKETGLDQKEISGRLKMKRSTFSGYINDKREPKLEVLKQIAGYFNVTTDYLVGHSDERNIYYNHLSEELNQFVREQENEEYILLARDLKARAKVNEKRKL